MRIRRSVHWRLGQPISLPFVACIGDVHPELIDGAPPPPKPLKPKRRECGPRLTEKNIRLALGKPEPPRPDEAQYEAVMRRIVREGA